MLFCLMYKSFPGWFQGISAGFLSFGFLRISETQGRTLVAGCQPLGAKKKSIENITTYPFPPHDQRRDVSASYQPNLNPKLLPQLLLESFFFELASPINFVDKLGQTAMDTLNFPEACWVTKLIPAGAVGRKLSTDKSICSRGDHLGFLSRSSMQRVKQNTRV